MAADANRFLCKAFDLIQNRLYAELYSVECIDEQEPDVMMRLRWIINNQTGCTVDHDLTCYLGKVSGSLPKVVPFDGSSTTSCVISITDTTDAASCSAPPSITIIL